MDDHDEGEHHRLLRRRHVRRDTVRRRTQVRRRLIAAGVGAAVLAALVLIVAPWSGGGGDDAAAGAGAAAGAPRIGALERNREPATKERQQAALDDVLGYTEFVRQGRPRKREVALTFDDGPGPYTDEIMHVLHKFDAPATFFVLGNMVDDLPQVTRRQLRQGHAVGAHTYDHPHMGQLPPETQAQELSQADAVFRAHNIALPRLFRPPYGSFDSETIRLLEERESLMVLWSVDTGDYENPGWDVIAQRALDGARPGAVILLHDAGGDRAQTIVALPLILEGLRKKGLKPVTVPELLVDDPPPRGQSLEQATAVEPPGTGLPAAPRGG